METVIYLITGLAGVVIGWLLSKMKTASVFQNEKERLQIEMNNLTAEYTRYEATSIAELKNAEDKYSQINSLSEGLRLQIIEKESLIAKGASAISAITADYAAYQARSESEIENAKEKWLDSSSLLEKLKQQILEKDSSISKATSEISTISAQYKAASQTILEKNEELVVRKNELNGLREELAHIGKQLATEIANNKGANEKLENQKKEIKEIGDKFSTEFENIANRIFESKTEKFTELNKTNINDILEPLGKNISEFKTKVEDAYGKESKERHSLIDQVKKLAELNQVISEEAKNLTQALKGESKTQGGWGEMILESILEKSGLEKDREYFMEHELRNEDGTHLKSDENDKKMRPDVVIKYPDDRCVIIDAKTSLNAFVRYSNAIDIEEKGRELKAHLAAVKKHVDDLSARDYDKYDKSLDFVMMFIPNEPAYIAAMQADSDLWSYAYKKRILLISPTNLIISLKLIVDLWKRESQNKNAQEIAKKGAALYDKIRGFVATFEKVGASLGTAQERYIQARGQLATGGGNMLKQANDLKELGVKPNIELSKGLVEQAIDSDAAATAMEAPSLN